MLCENCGRRGAEIHLVKVINGVRIEEDICRQCAEKMMPFHDAERALKMSFSLEGIMNAEDALKHLLFPMLPELYEIKAKELKCPHCGKEIAADQLYGKPSGKPGGDRDVVFDFSQSGKDAGTPLRDAAANSPARVKAAPSGLKTANAIDAAEKELAGLAKELEAALRCEKYERAAEIRDRVADLKKIISADISKESKEA